MISLFPQYTTCVALLPHALILAMSPHSLASHAFGGAAFLAGGLIRGFLAGGLIRGFAAAAASSCGPACFIAASMAAFSLVACAILGADGGAHLSHHMRIQRHPRFGHSPQIKRHRSPPLHTEHTPIEAGTASATEEPKTGGRPKNQSPPLLPPRKQRR